MSLFTQASPNTSSEAADNSAALAFPATPQSVSVPLEPMPFEPITITVRNLVYAVPTCNCSFSCPRWFRPCASGETHTPSSSCGSSNSTHASSSTPYTSPRQCGSKENIRSLSLYRLGESSGKQWRASPDPKAQTALKNSCQKILLDKIDLIARPGELMAITGPSGGGKTTLLNVLAMRSPPSKIVGGTIRFNGQRETVSSVRRLVNYVMAHDKLLPYLTVYETLYSAAELKLPHTPAAALHNRVEHVIQAVGLQDCRDAYIGGSWKKGVTTAQLKCVSIAVELLDNPSILILDEPTTALDSNYSLKIMRLLQNEARKGRTVIVSIHQPSSQVFELIDQYVLIASGRVIYQGNPAAAIPYFAQLGYKATKDWNPSDYFVALVSPTTLDDTQHASPLPLASGSARSRTLSFTSSTPPSLLSTGAQEQTSSPLAAYTSSLSDTPVEHNKVVLPAPSYHADVGTALNREQRLAEAWTDSVERRALTEDIAIVNHRRRSPSTRAIHYMPLRPKSSSCKREIWALWKRSSLNTIRNPLSGVVMFLVLAMQGLILGGIFYSTSTPRPDFEPGPLLGGAFWEHPLVKGYLDGYGPALEETKQASLNPEITSDLTLNGKPMGLRRQLQGTSTGSLLTKPPPPPGSSSVFTPIEALGRTTLALSSQKNKVYTLLDGLMSIYLSGVDGNGSYILYNPHATPPPSSSSASLGWKNEVRFLLNDVVHCIHEKYALRTKGYPSLPIVQTGAPFYNAPPPSLVEDPWKNWSAEQLYVDFVALYQIFDYLSPSGGNPLRLDAIRKCDKSQTNPVLVQACVLEKLHSQIAPIMQCVGLPDLPGLPPSRKSSAVRPPESHLTAEQRRRAHSIRKTCIARHSSDEELRFARIRHRDGWTPPKKGVAQQVIERALGPELQSVVNATARLTCRVTRCRDPLCKKLSQGYDSLERVATHTGDTVYTSLNFSGRLLFITAILGFASYDALLSFPQERALFNRETANGLYRPTSYFLAKNLADLPLQLAPTLTMVMVLYFFLGFDVTWVQYFTYFGLCALTSFAAYGFGYTVSAAAPRMEIAVLVAPLTLVIWLLLAGFFIRDPDIPSWLAIVKSLSFYRWSFFSLMINQFPPDRYFGNLPNTVLLKLNGVTHTNLTLTSLVLCGLGIAYRVLGCFFLTCTNRKVGLEA